MNNLWRFIPYAEYNGELNMAIDETLLEAHRRNECPPTLRLYGFKPSCITIGYSQKVDQNYINKFQSYNLAVVKRPTGGRAVLHHQNLTYSFIATADHHMLSGSIVKSYKQISQGIINAYENFGIILETNNNEHTFSKSINCFDILSRADLQAKGKKIVGSAQLRRLNSILQHGSINLYAQEDLSKIVFNNNAFTADNYNIFADENSQNIYQTNLIKNLPEIEKAFIKSFSENFNVTFEIKPLTTVEINAANDTSHKYKI